MYNKNDLNKHALSQSKKDVIMFLENNLNEFITNKAFKDDKKVTMDQHWISILQKAIETLKQSNKRKIKCFLNVSSIRVALTDIVN